MKTAIVTGASSGIGLEISKKLLENGFIVYGLGRDFKNDLGDSFVPTIIDLRSLNEMENFVKSFNHQNLDVLVNCAGVAYYGIHETISVERISEMVDVNLKAPMILTSLFLPRLRNAKGIIVDVSSVTAKQTSNTHGVAYGATKAGLSSFGESLFSEIRKQGVRVTTIHPDLTDTNLYRNADFTVEGDLDNTLFPDEIADVVIKCILVRDGMCVSDVTIKPQRFKLKGKR